jgi:hypothetical protein
MMHRRWPAVTGSDGCRHGCSRAGLCSSRCASARVVGVRALVTELAATECNTDRRVRQRVRARAGAAGVKRRSCVASLIRACVWLVCCNVVAPRRIYARDCALTDTASAGSHATRTIDALCAVQTTRALQLRQQSCVACRSRAARFVSRLLRRLARRAAGCLGCAQASPALGAPCSSRRRPGMRSSA